MHTLTKFFFSILCLWFILFLFFYSGTLDFNRLHNSSSSLSHSVQVPPKDLSFRSNDHQLSLSSIESENVQSLTEKLKLLQKMFSEKNEVVERQKQLIETLREDHAHSTKKYDQSSALLIHNPTDRTEPNPNNKDNGETGREYVSLQEVQRISSLRRDFMKEEKWENKNNHSRITILTWDYPRGGGWAYLGANPLRAPNYLGQDVAKSCPVTCEVTGEKLDIGRSHAILFEPQAHQGHDWEREPLAFPLKFAHQRWGSFGYEQWHYFPLHVQGPWKQYMDFNMTFEQRDPVQITFTCSWGGGELSDYLIPPPKKTKLVAAIISNCGGGGAFGRIRYLRELMKYIPIDSYGRCEHTAELPPEMIGEVYADHGKAMRNKVKLFRDYKFVLAFENNNVTDYITEKIYNVLQAGSVPIYMGSSTIDNWIPGEHSIIRTDQFSGPKELAEYIKKLDQDDKAYNEYFEWKKHGLLNTFIDKYKKCAFYNSECRLCKYLADNLKPSEFIPDMNPRNALSMGADSWIQFEEHSMYDLTTDYTLAAWIFGNDLEDRRIIDKNPSGVVKGYNFDVILRTGRKEPYLRLCAGSACFYSVHSLKIKTWIHVAVSFSASRGSVCLYINGWRDSCNLHGTPTEKNDRRLHLGATQGSPTNRWDGMLDEIMIWNVSLLPEQMKMLPFTQYIGAEQPDLIGYYKFDHHEEKIAIDSSKYKRHGTIGGGATLVRSATKPMPMIEWAY